MPWYLISKSHNLILASELNASSDQLTLSRILAGKEIEIVAESHDDSVFKVSFDERRSVFGSKCNTGLFLFAFIITQFTAFHSEALAEFVEA